MDQGAATRIASRDTTALLLLTGFAFAVRLTLCLATLDVPGDGPTRAIWAWEWAQSPSLVTYGVWPPGLLYLSGLVSVVVSDPRWAVRLVNLAAGAATIPIVFLLVRTVFAADVAWGAALSLSVLPLHVELSATSLSEPTFVLEILVGFYFLVLTRDPTRTQTAVGLLALLWATMSRYEAWWLAPVMVASVAVARRRWSAVAAVAVAVFAFPIAWSVGNFVALGDPLYGFTMTAKGAEIGGTPPIGLWDAVAMLASLVTAELGWPLALGVPMALVLTITNLAITNGTRLRLTPAIYAAVTGTFWIVMTWFAMRRGHSVFNRYVLLGIVLLLPYAALPWCRLARRLSPRAVVIVGVVLACSLIAPRLDRWPMHVKWITWTVPRDVEALTTWMRESEYRSDPIVLTSMGWTASYFTSYWPAASPQRIIVSEWTENYELETFLARRRPALLATTSDDAAMRRRVEALAGDTTIDSLPIRTFGAIEVYRLRRSAR